ncbi:MAG TPA: siderophore-interacting protein [Caulobacteraceae bacterium]|nr:siderophore-interacting protein [Caulobacteraceae bacterium]
MQEPNPGLLRGLFPAAMRRPPLPAWRLEVVGQSEVTPRMARVRFTGELDGLTWRPGQDLVLSIPQAGGEAARRHYTIRSFDPATRLIDIDFVLHGESPAVRWARQAKAGEAIEARGPRGRTRIAEDVDRHLFLGDETGIPGIFAMAEALPPGAQARALIEVANPAEQQSLSAQADVHIEWLNRNGERPGPSDLLLDRLAELAPSPENTHAYVIGETSNVRSQRHHLLAHGFDKARITAEGYWRPGRIGGHDHV